MLKTQHKARKGLTEQDIFRREHDRWLRSIRITPSELTDTRAIAERHHQHDFLIENGVATVLVHCKTCPLRQGTFKEWVTA